MVGPRQGQGRALQGQNEVKAELGRNRAEEEQRQDITRQM